METGDRETEYRVYMAEGMVLVLDESGPGATLPVPERLVKRLREAEAALAEAENEVARWAKYSASEDAKRELGPIIGRLPATEDWKRDRKRR